MFSITLITGLASLMGCLCMAIVCAAQIAELIAAAQPAPPRPWDTYAFQPGLVEAYA